MTYALYLDDKLGNPPWNGAEIDLFDPPLTVHRCGRRSERHGSESKRGAPHIGTPLSISCWT